MKPAPRYWFPAKSYGWGWGPPCAWQGWAVIACFALLAVAGIFLFPPEDEPGALMVYLVTLNIGLMTICWLTGEPPGWRWGRKPRR